MFLLDAFSATLLAASQSSDALREEEIRITVITEAEIFLPFYPITSFGTIAFSYGENKLLRNSPLCMMTNQFNMEFKKLTIVHTML